MSPEDGIEFSEEANNICRSLAACLGSPPRGLPLLDTKPYSYTYGVSILKPDTRTAGHYSKVYCWAHMVWLSQYGNSLKQSSTADLQKFSLHYERTRQTMKVFFFESFVVKKNWQ